MNTSGGGGGGASKLDSSTGDTGLVEQVANIVMIRVQSDIELKIQGCLTKEDFEKYTSSQEVFSSNLQRDTNGTYQLSYLNNTILDALTRASKAFDDLIVQGKRLNKIDEKMRDFVIKDNLDMELKSFYTPLKSFNQLEENLYLNYTRLNQFDDYKMQ